MSDKGQLIIYKNDDGAIEVQAHFADDTIWLTQDLMSALFQTTIPNISMHIANIFEEGELDKKRTIKDFLTVRKEGTREVSRNLTYYNLDMILSVGYRIKSKTATQFRIWATDVLRKYLTKGYAINEQRLKSQQEQIVSLKTAIALVERSLSDKIETLEQAKELTALLNDFACGLQLLDDYDHKRLDNKGKTEREAVQISADEFLQIINDMKPEFASDVFAVPKDDSFSSSVTQIYQTVGGLDCYPSIEEKAAMLLYLIVKNHSFTDGNKRIGAACFLYFADKNDILYNNGSAIIDSGTLFALTVLIAESKPQEMEIVKNMLVSVLNRAKD